jgi:hypothetical protein
MELAPLPLHCRARMGILWRSPMARLGRGAGAQTVTALDAAPGFRPADPAGLPSRGLSFADAGAKETSPCRTSSCRRCWPA